MSLSRLGALCKGKMDQKRILEAVPYLGLDIEDLQGDVLSVEYSPNRPDFSSEVGIARSLTGILGLNTGVPKYIFAPSKFRITVADDAINRVRPKIQALYAEISVTDELIRQLINMQEDLHNGIGRKRAKVAIGIHNPEAITNQLNYHATNNRGYLFAPLGSDRLQSIAEILESTEQGRTYGRLLGDSYPILEDSRGEVLSMPPIINGNVTRLSAGQSKLFLDVTGTDERAVDVSAAILASMLYDSGATVYSVEVTRREGSIWTPDMSPRTMRFDLELTRNVMGYDFSMKEAESFLARCRIGMYPNGNAMIPRYRFDIIHPIDLVEEVALGFGIQQIKPMSLKTSLAGSFSKPQKRLDMVIEALVGLGLTEIWNFSLIGSSDATEGCLKVEDSKSQNFEFLRGELCHSLLSVLGASSHQEYPQRIFEQSTVFRPSEGSVTSVTEEEHVAAMVADSGANYSIIHSMVESLLHEILPENSSISYRAAKDHTTFAMGRSAIVTITNSYLSDVDLGVLGEVNPEMLDRYGLKIPVVGFEIDLEPLIKG